MLLIKEYFPFVPSTLLSSIIEKINQNTDHIEFSHMINGRWENQYFSFHFIPEVLNILRLACRAGRAITGKSLIIPNKGLGFSADEFWFNIAMPGDATGWHDHKSDAILSGVYYLDVPKNSGHINFRKRLNNLWNEFYLRSETGKMILFDSKIQHSVTENQSNARRISLAFNMYTFPLQKGIQ